MPPPATAARPRGGGLDADADSDGYAYLDQSDFGILQRCYSGSNKQDGHRLEWDSRSDHNRPADQREYHRGGR
ncbi:MAG TPA: hypothetical protein P5159_26620 [Phycisphaerae bacterium]|nr:hypothetical protein [Phycisphaerae bacterium]HSA30124.1 hypothetical protein [Phycisphaerae bacterium]